MSGLVCLLCFVCGPHENTFLKVQLFSFVSRYSIITTNQTFDFFHKIFTRHPGQVLFSYLFFSEVKKVSEEDGEEVKWWREWWWGGENGFSFSIKIDFKNLDLKKDTIAQSANLPIHQSANLQKPNSPDGSFKQYIGISIWSPYTLFTRGDDVAVSTICANFRMCVKCLIEGINIWYVCLFFLCVISCSIVGVGWKKI